jgi:microcompartment protein CcmK/EutM
VKLARVVGTVVSTINVPVYDGRTLLLCDLLDPAGAPAGGYLIAVDTVGAGAGETVLLLDEGNSARQILAAPEAPIRTLVVGIVDHVELEPGTAAAAKPLPGPGRRARRRPAP